MSGEGCGGLDGASVWSVRRTAEDQARQRRPETISDPPISFWTQTSFQVSNFENNEAFLSNARQTT